MNHNLNIKIYENNILLSATDTNCLIEDNFLSYNTDSDNIRINLKKRLNSIDKFLKAR